jgi:hypothetical protein
MTPVLGFRWLDIDEQRFEAVIEGPTLLASSQIDSRVSAPGTRAKAHGDSGTQGQEDKDGGRLRD